MDLDLENGVQIIGATFAQLLLFDFFFSLRFKMPPRWLLHLSKNWEIILAELALL